MGIICPSKSHHCHNSLREPAASLALTLGKGKERKRKKGGKRERKLLLNFSLGNVNTCHLPWTGHLETAPPQSGLVSREFIGSVSEAWQKPHTTQVTTLKTLAEGALHTLVSDLLYSLDSEATCDCSEHYAAVASQEGEATATLEGKSGRGAPATPDVL